MLKRVLESKLSIRGKTALVTGASSGIGRAIALELAKEGVHLVVAARRRDRLDEVAAEARALGVTVRVVTADLSTPGGAAQLFAAAIDDHPIELLINNAGIGLYGPFVGQPWDAQQKLLQLNVISMTELTHRFVHHMLEHRRESAILHVSSIAAFQATPGFAVYGPSKSYVRDFSEALAYELAGSNVRMSCLLPGGTRTEFSDTAGQSLKGLADKVMMTPEEVAEIGIAAMRRGRRSVVAGRMNKMNALVTRFMPRRMSAWMVDVAMRSSVDAAAPGQTAPTAGESKSEG